MKYGPEITEEVARYLKNGNNRTDSVTLSGISYETFTVWMGTKPEFSEAIKRAEAECKARNITIIQKAAIKTWQAAAWYLERRFQDEYAIRQKLELNDERGNRPTADVLISTIRDLRGKITDLRKGAEVPTNK